MDVDLVQKSTVYLILQKWELLNRMKRGVVTLHHHYMSTKCSVRFQFFLQHSHRTYVYIVANDTFFWDQDTSLIRTQSSETRTPH